MTTPARAAAGPLALLALAALLLAPRAARAMQITVPASGDECFTSELEQANKLSGSFEVLQGGLLDVDCVVTGPNRETHYSTQRQKSGAFSLLAPTTGSYAICFSNRLSTQAEKTVAFSLHSGDALFRDVAKQEHVTPLESEITQLSDAINKVEDEQSYMVAREAASRAMNDSTNRRVLWFSVLEAVVFVALGFWQYSYLSKGFETKRRH